MLCVIMQGAVKLIGQSVEICTYLEVPAVDIKIQTDSGEVTIEPPSVHLGYKPIPLYLLSYKWRGSQVQSLEVKCTTYQPIHLVRKFVVSVSAIYRTSFAIVGTYP